MTGPRPLNGHDASMAAAIVLLACLATALAPVQLLIEPVQGSLRPFLLPMAGLVGFACATRAGLAIVPRNTRDGLVIPALVGLAVALPILFLDRASLGSTSPETLQARLTYFPLRSLNEEVIYRLGAMSVFAWALTSVGPLRGAGGKAAAFVLAAALAQALNCLVNIPIPQMQAEPVYVLVRFFAPGVLWGLLYWRLGFAAAAVGHVAGHLWLQPAATWIGG